MNKSKQQLLNQFIQSLMKVRRIAEQSFTEIENNQAITLLQRQAMMYLKAFPTSTVGELASEMDMSSSAIAQFTDRLVDLGFIAKEIDKNDRRIVRLSLTANGKVHLESCHRVLLEKVSKVFSHMSEEDLKEVVRIFTNFLETVEKEKRII